ncbi:MAG TPA: hypothetical protein VK524_23915, partial [Polyangiaceae bacterium]|nr:hypothetical protein [Polyangiaceae bacterium]
CATIIRSGLPAAAAAALAPQNARCMQFEGREQCMFVPSFRRINTRPDGLEVVLVENRSDPFYAVYSESSAVCSRPEGSSIAAARASYGSVFVP